MLPSRPGAADDLYMSDLAQRLANLSPAQRQLLQQRLEKARKPAAEPIAIIGMACRFPGAPTLQDYWSLIRDGRSAVCEVPNDRWNVDEFYDPTGEMAGKMSVRWAALIDGPDQFDPQFFGITPREAARMDPQQRLLLEVAWEAMENAGRPADQMAGSRTGVFIGIGGTDYSKVCVPYDDYYQHIDAHMGTGNALSISANRLSYIFDFRGPSAAIDTACSSSSLAIHFAVESLRRGESDAALAGGVNMILTPETTIAFSKARMLSPDGVCRPFDAAANGYVRGEGCGLVLLKRLADAERDGDNILAVLRATSVNQDGRTSGISAPNSQSQVACIRAALSQAGLVPEDIDYIEAHGTGTPLGDPIEMQALGQIFGDGDECGTRPCFVSSVKANVGHMETVSGVAGLTKVVLMMQHGEVAPQANFESLNTHINLAGTRLVVPTQRVPWRHGERPRVAGVSSFGFGGTNTHLIVESFDVGANQQRESPSADRPTHLLRLSAKTQAAIVQQAARLADYLTAHPYAALADVCWSWNTGRADFNHRAVIAAASTEQLQHHLTKLASSEAGGAASAAGIKQATVRTLGRPKVAFLFTGQGSQYAGMGRGLFESHPVFRGALERCDRVLRDHWGGKPLFEILYPPESNTDNPNALIHQTQYTQPALFALEYALFELWRSWGVMPDIVLGHSVGEYAAACAVGVMSVEDGLALIAQRARLMQTIRRRGKMAVVFAPHDRVAEVLRSVASDIGNVVVAVVNGPENTVISGDADAVDRVVEKLASDGVQAKPLNVSHAFHSPLMDEMLEEFEQCAANIAYQAPQVPLAANLTGQLMTQAPTARYWRDHLRNTVQFAEGMARVAEAGPAMIIELGPTTSLLGMGRRCVPDLQAAWLPSLRQGSEDWQVLSGSVAEYYVRGGQINWRGWDRPWPRSRMSLPNYPFQRSRHWYTLEPALRRTFSQNGEAAMAAGIPAAGESTHPLLGARLSLVSTHTFFETRLGARSPVYLADHRVQGSTVTPAAAYIEQGLAAAAQVLGSGRHGLANLNIQQAMFLPDGGSGVGHTRRVQISIGPESAGEAAFETYSCPADALDSSAPWVMHATGTLQHESKLTSKDGLGGRQFERVDLDAIRGQAVRVNSRDDFYRWMSERGLAYGPAFQVLDELYRGERDSVARVVLPESVVREANKYHLHPVLGDALLQSMAGAVPLEEDGSYSPYTYMPVGVRQVRVLGKIEDFTRPLYTYAVRTSSDASPSPERVGGDVLLVDEAGDVLVALEGVEVQRLGRTADGGAESATDTSRWLYRIAWRESAVPAAADQASTGVWLIFADGRGIGRGLADRLATLGHDSLLIEPADTLRWMADDSGNGKPGRSTTAKIDPLEERHYQQIFENAFVATGRTCLGIVHLWSLDIPEESGTLSLSPALTGRRNESEPLRASRRLGCGSALQLARTLSRAKLTTTPKLWLVTCGAQAVEAVESAPVAAAQSPLWGLGRVAALELADFRPRLVDLDPTTIDQHSQTAIAMLGEELLNSAAENQIAHRGGRRFVARITREPTLIENAAGSAESLAMPSGKPFQLRIMKTGSLDALRFKPVDREPPAAGQVEIAVHATGLNFSDVLKALGLYPGIKDAIVPLGIEASGVVTAVGEGVTRFRQGDEVFGVVPYAFASHARSAEYALVHKPKSIDHDQACTIPITFLTAYYGLVHLAHLQPGERVLIHAGAGGVGLAAIQIAQQIGAVVFATAGSDEKRDFLKSIGVDHVYSSRTLDFAEQILADTGRDGVDVVLNSLPGAAITKSLSLLRAYGRFLEIGKTDIYQNRMIGLLPFQDNLSYFAIDLDRMLRQRPDFIRELFAEVMKHFETGEYRPLMFTRFEAGQTIDAFRYMSQRKNIGKVVVSIADCGIQSVPEIADSTNQSAIRNPKSEIVPRSDGTYLITGGLGALGLQVAVWLAEQGAGTVALLSRRSPSPESERSIAAIRERGAQVIVLTGDVANAQSLAGALAQLPADAPPLRGVVHAAGVLADGVLSDMTLDQLDRALAPKMDGAYNLHVATLEQPLDFFVLFSSVASVLGSPGQANYAAGNAYLDALAHVRRALGLPAIAINWGPWAGSGMAAEANRDQAVQSRGIGLLEPARALELLGRLVRTDAAQVAVMDARWDDMFRMLGTRRPSLLAEIAEETQQAGGSEPQGGVDHSFRQRLLSADEVTRESLVREYIRDELARIMGVEPSSLEIDQPLSTFGLDSLLALELKNNLESRLDFTLPMAKLMEGPSIASLAEETVRLVVGSDAVSSAGEGAEQWTSLLALRSSGGPETTGGRPPLVLLPALGGDVRCYAELVQQLDEEQPVYAFRPRGVDQDLPPHVTMDEMIGDYLAALRELQPSGPYFLAGWSTGGIFAFALAEVLERAGDEVAMLALFDTPLPSICDDVDVEDDARFLCDLVNFANRFAGTDVRVDLQDVSLSPEERFRAALAEARRQGTVPQDTPEEFIRRLVRVGEANVRVIQSYEPDSLAAPVHLFVPHIKGGLAEVSGREMPEDEDHGWSTQLGQPVELHQLPGDHFTMMLGEGAAQLARQLERILSRVSTSAQQPPEPARN
jgi:acyl transferase domain-containing protein/NADPH:quinone reductase-like Zn-dependent oxidoreductase/thioesterase domain-containing protein/nucleoside-diphosphate-sugar epimerase